MSDQSYTPELISSAIQGDDVALSFLYESAQAKVIQTVRSMIRDHDTALDIVQDSFVKGFRNLSRLDKPENFLAWMRRIATNTAVDYIKKKRPVLFSELTNEDGAEIEFQDENIKHLPDVLLDQRETSRLIQEIVNGLSEEQQLVIGMFYFEEMSIRNIAKKLGCSENTVKSRLSYGRKNIEKQVRELENKGTKLYSIAPLPFFLWLLRNLHTQPSQEMLGTILSQCATFSSGAVSAANFTTANSVVGAAGAKAAGSAAKKIAVRIMAGVLAAAVVGGGAALFFFGGSSDPAPTQEATVPVTETRQPEQSTETTAPTTEPPVDPTQAYQKILDEYTAVCYDEKYLDPEQHPNTYTWMMSEFHENGKFDLYYAYYDLDHNGVDELMIRGEDTIFDMYAFDGEKAVKIINENSLGTHSSLQIMETGEIYIGKSDGMGSGVEYVTRLSDDGFTIETLFYAKELSDAAKEYGDGYLGVFDGEHLTMEELSARISNYTQVTKFPWIMFYEAPMTRDEAYQVIMNEYIAMTDAMYNGTYAPNQQPHAKDINWDNLNSVELGNSSGFHFAYSYYDLDQNGTMELLIGYAAEFAPYVDFSNMVILDVYTFNGTQAVQLFPERSLGDTATLRLVNDSELYFVDDRQEGGSYVLARIAQNGYSLEVLYSYQTRMEDGTVIYYNDTEAYTEYEFMWALPPIYAVDDIEWTGFAMYSKYMDRYNYGN